MNKCPVLSLYDTTEKMELFSPIQHVFDVNKALQTLRIFQICLITKVFVSEMALNIILVI